jgi:hypothetical protein
VRKRASKCVAGYRAIHDDHVLSSVDNVVAAPQVEVVYRQLRAGLEASKAAPAAADFYYGEMEMRRRSARLGERLLLNLYKWVGGYGVRPLRPFFFYMALLLGTAGLGAMANQRHDSWFTVRCSQVEIAQCQGPKADVRSTRFGRVLVAVARNSISLLSAPDDGLKPMGSALLLVERFGSITLLGLAAIGVRSKVQR